MAFHLKWPTNKPCIRQPFGVNWTGDSNFFSAYGLPGHEGIDFEAEEGDEVYACADGIISRISLDGDSDTTNKPYGNQIRLRHETWQGQFVTIYANLKDVVSDLKIGDTVKAGDLIGFAGKTGHTDEVHLHLTLKKKDSSTNGETYFPHDVMDPTPFLLPLGAIAHAEPTDKDAVLTPPPVPIAFNKHYRLQKDEAWFRRAWSWASGGSGNQRWLNLIATANAPYSNQQMRQVGTTLYVEDAIAYLNPQDPPNGTPRYWRTTGTTFCNIFVNDVTRILQCEIPNNPSYTAVSQMMLWLENKGEAAGWKMSTDGKEAQDYVNKGHVAVMIWSNKVGRDHVALVRPGEGKDVDNFFWPRVAQAGAAVSSDISSYDSFGQLPTDLMRFYLHE